MSRESEIDRGGQGEAQLVPGPAGPIEAIVSYPPDFQVGQPIAIVCHPHPLHGGSLNNKVVYTVAKTFNELGVVTLRFNFRGVGESAGSYDQGRGEAEDVLALAQWLRDRFPASPLWLAGFSFGAYVAARAQQQGLEAERLLLIAPPVTMFDFSALGQIEAPGLMVVQGGKDEVIDPDAVADWTKTQDPGLACHWMTSAGHFYHGRLNRLHDIILRAWGPASSD